MFQVISRSHFYVFFFQLKINTGIMGGFCGYSLKDVWHFSAVIHFLQYHTKPRYSKSYGIGLRHGERCRHFEQFGIL